MNCSTCKKCLNIDHWDYSNTKVEHLSMQGFACLAFVHENWIIWMTGANPDKDYCEEYSPK